MTSREYSLDYGENVEIGDIKACYGFFDNWFEFNTQIVQEIEGNGRGLDKVSPKRLDINGERYLVLAGIKGNGVECQKVVGRITEPGGSKAEPVNGEIDMLERELEGDVEVLGDAERYLSGH